MLFKLFLFVFLCLVIQIQASSHQSYQMDFNYTSIATPLNATFSMQFMNISQVAFQILWNVSDVTELDIQNVTLQYTQFVLPQNGFKLINSTASTGALGKSIDPCLFPVVPDSEVALSYTASTNAATGTLDTYLGAVDILTIQNATSFKYESPLPNLQDEVQSDSWAAVTVAGFGNCPTYQFTETILYWRTFLDTNITASTNLTHSDFYWVHVVTDTQLSTPPTLTFTWRATDVVLPPLTDGPSAGPVAGPSAAESPNNNVPTWAVALLVVFGIVIGILVVVAIVMGIKAKQRAAYTAV